MKRADVGFAPQLRAHVSLPSLHSKPKKRKWFPPFAVWTFLLVP